MIAFEPVTETFELLAANAARFRYRNVTLLNVAVSESATLIGMTIPKFESGLNNYYRARLIPQGADFHVLCITIDSLLFPQRIALAKIDAEGHELQVLKGMKVLLQRDHPTLIVEDNVPEVIVFLKELGYSWEKLEGSPNLLFYPGFTDRSRLHLQSPPKETIA